MTMFMSKNKRYSLVIDGGSTKPVPDGHGGFNLHTFQDIVARFSNHELNTEAFFNTHEKELLDRGWTLERIDEKIRKSPNFKRNYWEIKPVTREDKIKAAMAFKARAEEMLKAVDGLSEETPEVVEVEKKEKVYVEKCPDCDWVAKSSVSQSQAKNKLRGHRAGKHKK